MTLYKVVDQEQEKPKEEKPKEEKPPVKKSMKVNNITFVLVAPEGVLEEGTEMEVIQIDEKDKEKVELIEKALQEEKVAICSLDINLYKDGDARVSTAKWQASNIPYYS